MRIFDIDKIQFVWFGGKPLFHWWAYPPNFREKPVFSGKPIMWRLALGWIEIRIFPKRDLLEELRAIKMYPKSHSRQDSR